MSVDESVWHIRGHFLASSFSWKFPVWKASSGLSRKAPRTAKYRKHSVAVSYREPFFNGVNWNGRLQVIEKKLQVMSDDWIINVLRFAGYDRLQCPRNLQAQQLNCVVYHIRWQGIFSISTKNWSNLCDLLMASCFSWQNTRASRSCSFSSFLFTGKNNLAFKKISSTLHPEYKVHLSTKCIGAC